MNDQRWIEMPVAELAAVILPWFWVWQACERTVSDDEDRLHALATNTVRQPPMA
jgi:hypothetical protein